MDTKAKNSYLLDQYRDVGDMSRRLVGCFACYKDDWFYVNNVNSVGVVMGKTLATRSYIEIDGRTALATDFNIENVPLGYSQINTVAIFLSRQPLKRVMQGVGPNNLYAIAPSPYMEMGWNSIMNYGKGLVLTFNQKYPSFEESFGELVKKTYPDKPQSSAFSCKLALDRSSLSVINLCYRGQAVGETTVDNSDRKFTLYPRYQYLKELFEDEGLRIKNAS